MRHAFRRDHHQQYADGPTLESCGVTEAWQNAPSQQISVVEGDSFEGFGRKS